MSKNQLLISSDHHANWDVLEKLFEYAKNNKLPFVINGDVVGDYNFTKLKEDLNLKYSDEIVSEKLEEKLNKFDFNALTIYSQVQQLGGNYTALLNQIQDQYKKQAEENITRAISHIQTEEFKKRFKKINEKINNENEHIISLSHTKLRALYNVIIKEQAKKFAKIIDKYKIKTYFVNGNHEPIHFPKLVSKFLKDKNLFIDLGNIKGIQKINGIRICAMSNVNALMPFIPKIFEEDKIEEMFIHQRSPNRSILFKNVSEETINNRNDQDNDFDWIRISEGKDIENLDVFVTHGQIGYGSWREGKNTQPVPTLFSAAKLCSIAKLTVDGHLHTTHEMESLFGKPLIRAVGNKGFVISKDNFGKITYELIEVEAQYNHNNGFVYSGDLNQKILGEIFEK